VEELGRATEQQPIRGLVVVRAGRMVVRAPPAAPVPAKGEAEAPEGADDGAACC